MPMDGDLKDRLLSDDIATKIFAIQESAEIVREIVHTALQGLLVPDHAFVLSYEMAKFGPVMVSGLENLLREAPPGEAKVCIALLLLSYGSWSGVEIAIEEIRSGGPWMFHAANRLSAARIEHSGPVIVERLRQITQASRFDPRMSGGFVSFFRALEKLGLEIPEDISDAMSEEGVPRVNRIGPGQAPSTKEKEN